MKPEYKEFLIGLEELSRRTGVYIDGCGCCGSPALGGLVDLTPEEGYHAEEDGLNVRWLQPGDYEWENGLRPVKP